MALETATYISDLVSTNPTASDNISQGDDHIRLLKATVKASFPNVTGAMTRTHTDLNNAVTLAGSETLTNKSLTSPTITGTAILGAGNASASPVDAILAGASGSGTNIAGADIIVRAGNGTGTGGSGYISFETAAAGSTGSTANTLTERMRIDNAGNVGIGTSSPADKFVVFGDNARSTAIASTTAGNIIIEAQASNYYSAPNYTGTGLQQYGSAATGTTVGLSNANLGILRFQNVSAGLIYTNGGSPLVFGTTFAERMRIDSSGNVGIGTTSTGYPLEVRRDNASATTYAIIRNATATGTFGSGIIGAIGTAGSNYYQLIQNGSGDTYLYNANAGNLFLGTNNTERLRIGSSGQLGIGGANYGTSGQVLTSGGAGAAPSWADPGGSFTLLGTLTTTGGAASYSLTGLDLTSYLYLYITLDGVSHNSGSTRTIKLSDSSTANTGVSLSAAAIGATATTSGWLVNDLITGIVSGQLYVDFNIYSVANRDTTNRITSADTSVNFVLSNTGGFDAGTIKIYGVK